MAFNEFGPLVRVAVTDVRDAFVDQETVDAGWRALNFTARPDYDRALREYDRFLEAVAATGAGILRFPRDDRAGLDAIYARDASIVTPHGVVLGAMGKKARQGEPAIQRAAFETWGVRVAGAIQPPGTLEGGDLIWLDARTVVVGRGYRTNSEGIGQLRAMLDGAIDELIVVPLPHWRGPGDVFHLMSMISPVDEDLAVVYSPLLPVPFREYLEARGLAFVEVPDEEFDRMGANVLALGPRRCLMVEGCPKTRALLERAGADVRVYAGEEISLKGGGGPTCLTRPLARGPS